MPEAIRIPCPHCRVRLKVKDRSRIGRLVSCPKCRRSFVVRAPQQPEEPAEAHAVDSQREVPPSPAVPPRRRQAKKRSAAAKKSPVGNWKKPVVSLGCSLLVTGLLIGLFFIFFSPDSGNSNPQSLSATASTSGPGASAVDDAAAESAWRTDPFAPSESVAGSWTQFRGPNRANISHEQGLLKSWPSGGPSLLWLRREIGDGYSTVSVADGTVFTMGNKYGNEMIWALDLATGNVLWSERNGSVYVNNRGDGPRGTPTFDGGNLYALGAAGALSCVDAKTGRLIWQKNILSEFEATNIQWGISESVLIDGERLICTPGGQGATMVALDKHNGKVIWKAAVPGNPRTAYASPIVVDVGGVRQYVNFTSRSVVGIRASDGALLWEDRSSANSTANCSTAIFYNGHIFSASAYGAGGALVKLESAAGATTASLVYKTKDMKNHHGGMVVVDGYLYGSNENIFTCLELRTGNVVWRNRSVGKGSVTYADGHIYLRSEKGPVALVEATPAEYREKGRFQQPQRSGCAAWPHPVVADGKLFLRDMDVLLCYDLKAQRK